MDDGALADMDVDEGLDGVVLGGRLCGGGGCRWEGGVGCGGWPVLAWVRVWVRAVLVGFVVFCVLAWAPVWVWGRVWGWGPVQVRSKSRALKGTHSGYSGAFELFSSTIGSWDSFSCLKASEIAFSVQDSEASAEGEKHLYRSAGWCTRLLVQ